ncbi:MAG: putative ATPase (AAA+ superfamily) [Candidatus Saganbacteria bacterium]|uniref:Putative ATPase (AAA+ superfamily) n=1 Tax=Candidatus Saganbacteria bacterium TaxID=2575572 RepID=A0A833L1J5_UNCSA|nr:MAG: putative ATPase (AAA+ superfamily) [Candidatus Saganbacteria bacterium]
MFNRSVEKNLLEWKNKKNRKPLVLRGARQTGKTTIVRKFAKQFNSFIELNLEKDAIRQIFNEVKDIKDIVQSIEGLSNSKIMPKETLLFLDEIQNSVTAIKLLRYFYEEMPDLHIISAGSLLEVRMKTEGWSFPVGRVEFLYLYPVTFEEFLAALNEKILLESLNECSLEKPMPLPLQEKAFDLLADYMIVGGMPEMVSEYLSNKNFTSIRQLQEELILSIKEDFAKYSNHSEVEFMKLVWDKAPTEIGKRIKYSNLAGSYSAAKNISKAFDILHEAMLVERIFPTVCFRPPLIKKIKAAPKLAFLDVGLCTHALKLTKDQVKQNFMSPVYGGALFESFISQELLALNFDNRNTLYFWIREEKGATSELDFLIQINNQLIPIEVKSGGHGSLKSLHQFLYRSKTNLGIRLYNGVLQSDNLSVKLPNGENINYKLLSVPIYLIFRLKYLILSKI